MAVVIDTANYVDFVSGSTTTTFTTTSATVGSGDTFLVIFAEGYNPNQGHFTAISWNGASLTLLGRGATNAVSLVEIWYLANPTPGTGTITVTCSANLGGFSGVGFIPMSGVNIASPFGTAVFANNNTGTPISVTATGAGANDVYVGMANIQGSSISNNGTTMVNLGNIPGSTLNDSWDYILGSNSGVFTWTAPAGGNNASAGAVAVFGAPSGWPAAPSAPGRRGPIRLFQVPVNSGPPPILESLTGQTITSTEGTVLPNVGYSPTGQTITSSEGTISDTETYGLTAETATFAEGTVTDTVTYGLTAETGTFAEGTISPTVPGNFNLSGQTATFTEGTITATGGDTGVIPSQAGGSGKKRKVKYAHEIFQEEMAKLERHANEATAQREEIEEKVTHFDSQADIERYIADFERALKRAQAREKRQAIDVPIYFRLPKKSVGVERIENFERLKSLAEIARHRELVAQERLRKVRDRIDEEAAFYLMKFLMWDD